MSTCVGFLFSGKPLHNVHAQALLKLGVLSAWQTRCCFQLSVVCKHQPAPLACVDLWLLGNRELTPGWAESAAQMSKLVVHRLKPCSHMGHDILSKYCILLFYSSLWKKMQKENWIPNWNLVKLSGCFPGSWPLPEVGLLEVRLLSVSECARAIWAVGYTSVSCWCSWGELFFLVSCSTLQCYECRAVFCAVGEWRLFILNSRFWEIKRQVYFDSSVVCL